MAELLTCTCAPAPGPHEGCAEFADDTLTPCPACEAAAAGAELREKAAEHERLREESWQRSDTDGFLSQWASGLTAQLYRRQAEIVEAGGVEEFGVLIRKGTEFPEVVPAKLIETRYGTKWAVFGSWAEALSRSGQVREWITMSDRSLARKGYELAHARLPAAAKIAGEGTGLSGRAWVTTYCTVKGLRLPCVSEGREVTLQVDMALDDFIPEEV